MAKLSKASEYVVRWRARGRSAEWIARQVFGFVRANWRRWKVDDYLLSPEEARLFARVEAREKEKREKMRKRDRLQEQRRLLREEFNRTAILADAVCTALGCTKEELSRWKKNTSKIPPDGKCGRFHAWLPATVEAAMIKVAVWRREDATRKNPCVSVAGLKTRGWTDSLIKTFLGAADRLARNPHYTSAGAPMRLYLLQRVEAVERSPAFLERRTRLAERAARRKASAAFNEATSRALAGAINRSTSWH